MNVRSLARAARGGGDQTLEAAGPLTITIDHAAGALFNFAHPACGSLFNFQRGAGELSAPDLGPAARTGVTLGAVTGMILGAWLLYRGLTSRKKLNLQTFGGFFLFGAASGNFVSAMDPNSAADRWKSMASAPPAP